MPRTKAFEREEVLKEAMELFWEKGFHATSVTDLVQRMGINKASIYDTFGDKHQLYLETLTYYRTTQNQMLNDALSTQDDVLHFLEDFLVQQQEDGTCDTKGCYMVNTSIDMAPHDEKVNKLVIGNMLNFEQKFEVFFELAQKEGKIGSTHSPKTLARFLYNNSMGLRVLSRTINDPQTIREIAKTVVETFK